MTSVARLIKAKTISFTEEIITHYKELNLTETEAIVLIFLFRKLDDQDNILSTSALTKKMTLSEDELSNLVVGLVQKGFIEISMEEGVESFELDGVYEALAAVLNQENTTAFIDRQDMLSQIVLYVETTYANPCAPADLMIINSWLDLGYSYNEIKTAVLDSLKAKKLHLKYADAILANRKTQSKRTMVEYDEDIKKMLDAMYVKR